MINITHSFAGSVLFVWNFCSMRDDVGAQIYRTIPRGTQNETKVMHIVIIINRIEMHVWWIFCCIAGITRAVCCWFVVIGWWYCGLVWFLTMSDGSRPTFQLSSRTWLIISATVVSVYSALHFPSNFHETFICRLQCCMFNYPSCNRWSVIDG